MGLLDPKMDKERTFELLRKRGVKKAILPFEGGHDEGDVQSITLVLADGIEEDLEVWYCGGYTGNHVGPGKYDFEMVPLSAPANEDEELSDLLQGPVNKEFGSWGDVPTTWGTLEWDVESEKVLLHYNQDRPVATEKEVTF